MNRKLLKTLISWKTEPLRKPLLLRGARQVGKTFLIRDFGKSQFTNLVEINFEFEPKFKKVFQTLNSKEIITQLQLILGVTIEANNTLLFFDEIQECPEAIMALRYFYEQLPQQAVIAAGSLLEFTLNSDDFRMPVGRVDSLRLHPMSFQEYLLAVSRKDLVEFLAHIETQTEIPAAIHETFLELIKKYFMIGGMPATIQASLSDLDFSNIQNMLLATYRSDFGKYSSKAKIPHLHKVFDTAPAHVAQIYKYSKIDHDTPSRELKQALNLLGQAGLITKIHATSGQGLPFLKDANERKFKILFLDIGLMQRSCGISAEIYQARDLLSVYTGAVAEQLVGQEILCEQNPRTNPELYFWSREKKNSQAEVDYLAAVEGIVFPIEVKSGMTGRLKSLKYFLQEYPKTPFGIRISQRPFSFENKILNVPIYAVGELDRLVKSHLGDSGSRLS